MNRVSREIRTTALVGILLLFVFTCALMAVAVFFAGSGEGEVQEGLKLIALIAAGTAVLIASLAALSSLLIALGFGDPNQAMSMPRGSIRAFMAILLIALFDALALWLFPQLDADPVNEAQERFAFQVLTTLSTLVAAAVAFYFGTRSVRTASETVSGVSGPVIDEVQPKRYSLASGDDPVKFVAKGSGLLAPDSVVFSYGDAQNPPVKAAVESWSGVNLRFNVPKAAVAALQNAGGG